MNDVDFWSLFDILHGIKVQLHEKNKIITN